LKIISNTAISLDGRIGTKDLSHLKLGSDFDSKEMSRIRSQADAVLMGGNTFRNNQFPIFTKRNTELEPMWNVILTRSGNLPFSQSYLDEKRIKTLVFSPSFNKKLPCERFESIVYDKEDFLPFVLENLAQRGIKTLLIEAGGDLIFRFLKAGLIDEMYITLCPKFIGERGAPTLLDGEGFKPERTKSAKLESAKIVDNEIYLHYTILDRANKH
jgi:riboflavin-specific deaminase-like protein